MKLSPAAKVKAMDALRSCLQFLEDGCDVLLITVLKASAGTPGKEGFKLALSSDGRRSGTVGGAAVTNVAITCTTNTYAVGGNGKKNVNSMAVHVPRIIEEECVGCNLCALVCPVDGCITMRQVDTGQPPMSWNQMMQQRSG